MNNHCYRRKVIWGGIYNVQKQKNLLGSKGTARSKFYLPTKQTIYYPQRTSKQSGRERERGKDGKTFVKSKEETSRRKWQVVTRVCVCWLKENYDGWLPECLIAFSHVVVASSHPLCSSGRQPTPSSVFYP